MKTIERVAEAIELTMYKWEYTSNVQFNEVAKAAIEALGIIILPHNAEPQEGDVIQGNEGPVDVVEKVERWNQVIPYLAKHVIYSCDGKIIQRQGKPVIMESEE